ncbi:MAG: hypothetical protein ACXVHB_05860 [Solirubrobacteraceae bacterium]
MRRLTLLGALVLSVVAPTTAAAATARPALVRAVASWAAEQGGHVIGYRAYPKRPQQELVRVATPVVLHPSGAEFTEYQTILAWRTPGWNHGVSMISVGDQLDAPPGLAFQITGGPSAG